VWPESPQREHPMALVPDLTVRKGVHPPWERREEQVGKECQPLQREKERLRVRERKARMRRRMKTGWVAPRSTRHWVRRRSATTKAPPPDWQTERTPWKKAIRLREWRVRRDLPRRAAQEVLWSPQMEMAALQQEQAGRSPAAAFVLVEPAPAQMRMGWQASEWNLLAGTCCWRGARWTQPEREMPAIERGARCQNQVTAETCRTCR
jgi:hypothetical protein